METKKFRLAESYPYYLAGKPVFANKDLEVTNKYTGDVVTCVAAATEETFNQAISAANSARESFRDMKFHERLEIVTKLIDFIKSRQDDFAQIITIESGKPIRDAKKEVERAIGTLNATVDACKSMKGEMECYDTIPGEDDYFSIKKRFPIGPVALISSWNFPLNLVCHKLGPALAVGNPLILKPSSRTPISSCLLGEFLSKAGLPSGAFSVLPCKRDAATPLIKDDRLKLVSFTGSAEAGWKMKSEAGKKKVVLELGGNAACIIDKDINIEEAVKRVVWGAFYQAGQSCISIQRLYLHEEIYEKFISALLEGVKELKKGDPLDESTSLGPLIDEKALKRIDEWVKSAKKKGAKILCGGCKQGPFYEATVLENVSSNEKIWSEEVFGPVLCVKKWSDWDDCVKDLNESRFGLQAGVFTNNWNRAWDAFERIEAGGVVINDIPSKRVDPMPYGGVKDSGFGREGPQYVLEEMTELRLMLAKKAPVKKSSL